MKTEEITGSIPVRTAMIPIPVFETVFCAFLQPAIKPSLRKALFEFFRVSAQEEVLKEDIEDGKKDVSVHVFP